MSSFGFEQRVKAYLLGKKGRVNPKKRVGVLRDENGDVYLFAPEGYYLALQTEDWKLFKVVLVKL